MKINLRTDKYLRKLIWISNLYGPPNYLSIGLKQYPMFFGKNFYLGAKIYRMLFEEQYTDNGDKENIIREILNKKISTQMGKQIVMNLEDLDIPIELNDDDKLFTDTANNLSLWFNENFDNANSLVKNVFGFPLPEEITLILAENLDTEMSVTGGLILDKDPVLIGYSRSFHDLENTYLPGIILHEMLHAIIGSNSLINRKTAKSRFFEEALLDYFCSYGIISEKLCLIKKASIDEYHRINVKNRPYTSNISNMLLPMIQNYYKNFENNTVWEYLDKNKFSDLINLAALDKLSL